MAVLQISDNNSCFCMLSLVTGVLNLAYMNAVVIGYNHLSTYPIYHIAVNGHMVSFNVIVGAVVN